MKKTLKKYFIPHAENSYQPHILRAKRAIFYSALAVAVKLIVVSFVLFLPAEVWTLPDVLSAEGKEIFRLTNELRSARGLKLVARVVPLDNSAAAKADDMARQDYFSHTSPDSHTLSYFLSQAGYHYRAAGENLAVGFADAESVFKAWQDSPAHFANLIDTDFSEFGIGLEGGAYRGQPAVYIVQHFGDPGRAVARKTQIPNSKFQSEKVSNVNAIAMVKAEKIEAGNDIAPLIKIGSPTPMERYLRAKRTLQPITSLFDVSRGVYFGLLIFFSIALALNILIEFRRQHPHVIANTLGLIALLALMIKL